MTKRPTEESGLVPARSLPALDGPEMREWATELVARARTEGVDLTGEGGLLTAMVRNVLQTGLEVELEDHLGYEPYEAAGRNSGNSRNGSTPKTVSTEIGDVDLRMPRDRNGTFEPVTFPKHQRRLDGLAGNVISLYAKGMTTGDIQTHLAEIYDTDISRETISKITDRIVEDMLAWQSRPLDRVYAVLLIDAIVIKVRDTQVANRPVWAVTIYGVCAVTSMMVMYALENRGRRFVLGFAFGCILSSIYGFLSGAWPFRVVELIWSGVALRRYQEPARS